MSGHILGVQGEAAAYKFIKDAGMRPLAKNYKKRSGEIDIIARDKGAIVFIEVKTRSRDSFGSPEAAVTRFKQRSIVRTALIYLKENKLLSAKIRFDVIAISGENVKHIKNAFDATELL